MPEAADRAQRVRVAAGRPAHHQGGDARRDAGPLRQRTGQSAGGASTWGGAVGTGHEVEGLCLVRVGKVSLAGGTCFGRGVGSELLSRTGLGWGGVAGGSQC